jgi:hypothetical protein
MKPPKNLIVFASLLLGSTFAWTQNFATTVQGGITAIPCQPPAPYHIVGTKDLSSPPNYQQTCKRNNGTSFGSASSQASLYSSEIANATTQNGGAASSNGEAIQTATLKPPSGFHGNTVTISYTDIWALNLSGVASPNAIGTVAVCWEIAQLQFKECQELSTNRSNAGKVSHQFVLTKDPKLGFKLTILKGAGTDLATFALGTSLSGGAITTSNPQLILPKGWTCKYDSGTKCP